MSVYDIVHVEDNNDNENSEGNQCDSDSDADSLQDDDTKEIQMVVNSLDYDLNVGNM